MKTVLLILATALVFGVDTDSQAMTASEVIDKSIEATGGLELLKSIQSQKMTGIYNAGGMEIPFSMTLARPDRMRIDAEFQGMPFTQCYAAGTGWQINPMMGTSDPQDLGAMEMKSFKFQSDMDGLLIDYEKKGYTAEYIGEDEVEGTPVHHVHIDTQDDASFDLYFDAEYFLVIKQAASIKVEENEINSETYMSDFKEVEGVLLPHAIETRMGGMTANTIMIESVEFGVDVAKDAFDRPAPAPKKEEAAVEGR